MPLPSYRIETDNESCSSRTTWPSGALRVSLQAEGYSAVEASNGPEGIDRVEATHPDLVILDRTLPAKDGWWLLREVQQCPGPRPVVIILSARAVQGERLVAHNLGCGLHGQALRARRRGDEVRSLIGSTEKEQRRAVEAPVARRRTEWASATLRQSSLARLGCENRFERRAASWSFGSDRRRRDQRCGRVQSPNGDFSEEARAPNHVGDGPRRCIFGSGGRRLPLADRLRGDVGRVGISGMSLSEPSPPLRHASTRG